MGIIHTIQKGDTLVKLAKRYYGECSRWREILEKNGMKSTRELIPGKIIKV